MRALEVLKCLWLASWRASLFLSCPHSTVPRWCIPCQKLLRHLQTMNLEKYKKSYQSDIEKWKRVCIGTTQSCTYNRSWSIQSVDEPNHTQLSYLLEQDLQMEKGTSSQKTWRWKWIWSRKSNKLPIYKDKLVGAICFYWNAIREFSLWLRIESFRWLE